MKKFLAFVITLFLAGAFAATAADNIKTVRVHFKAGESGATLKGQVKGYDTVDYILGARGGQSMVVILDTDNGGNFFNIMAPGASEAMFIGSDVGNRFEGELPSDGDYTIRVYLMRNEARRGTVAHYTLDVGIGN